MDLGLHDKTALVLGAGGGLGSAIAKTLAREGAKVAAASLHIEKAQTTADAITAAGGTAMALGWDLNEISVIEPNIAAIEARLGGIDILIANTGGPPPGGVVGQTPEKWRAFFESMVLSVFTITEALLPGMKARQWGRIITSTSSGPIAPIPDLGLSNTLRSALHGWSKTLAAEIGPDGITSNIVLPGRIATDRLIFLDGKRAEREGRSIESVAAGNMTEIPLRRYGDPQEYANVVTFLASQAASYVTGSIIRVDGGQIPSV